MRNGARRGGGSGVLSTLCSRRGKMTMVGALVVFVVYFSLLAADSMPDDYTPQKTEQRWQRERHSAADWARNTGAPPAHVRRRPVDTRRPQPTAAKSEEHPHESDSSTSADDSDSASHEDGLKQRYRDFLAANKKKAALQKQQTQSPSGSEEDTGKESGGSSGSSNSDSGSRSGGARSESASGSSSGSGSGSGSGSDDFLIPQTRAPRRRRAAESGSDDDDFLVNNAKGSANTGTGSGRETPAPPAPRTARPTGSAASSDDTAAPDSNADEAQQQQRRRRRRRKGSAANDGVTIVRHRRDGKAGGSKRATEAPDTDLLANTDEGYRFLNASKDARSGDDGSAQVEDEEEEGWRNLRGYGGSAKMNRNDPDSLPYPPSVMAAHRRKPKNPLPREWLEMPRPPAAPTGKAAWLLSRDLGLPVAWRARHRPTLFVLGTVGGGSLFIEECWRQSMLGNKTRYPYPYAGERWPTKRHPVTSEIIIDPLASPDKEDTWGRSGQRRWDPPKEWFVYERCGEHPHPHPACSHQRARWPPVEKATKDFVLMDASPDTLMNPHAANQTYFDLRRVQSHPRMRPRFIVTLQPPLVAAWHEFGIYYRFRLRPQRNYEAMFIEPRGLQRAPTVEELAEVEKQDVQDSFWAHIGQELGAMEEIPVCKAAFDDPAAFMRDAAADPTLARDALELCGHRMVGKHRGERWKMPHFLFNAFHGVGVRHWLHLGFEADQFVAVPTEELRWYSPEEVMDFLETAAPHMRRLPKRCEDPHGWDAGKCSGHIAWEKAHFFCHPARSPAAVPVSLFNTTKHLPLEFEGFTALDVWEISTSMHQATRKFLADVGIPVYNKYTRYTAESEQELAAAELGSQGADEDELQKLSRVDDLKALYKQLHDEDMAVWEQLLDESAADAALDAN